MKNRNYQNCIEACLACFMACEECVDCCIGSDREKCLRLCYGLRGNLPALRSPYGP
jgi:hypothetical protein